MRAQLGTPVRTRDDKAIGPVEWLLISPETRAVKSLGVRHGHIRDTVVKIPLKAIKVDPEMDHLIADADEESVKNLFHPARANGDETLNGEAVAASTGGGVFPADSLVPKPHEAAMAHMHTELQEMEHMADVDVVMVGDGSDVFTKNTHQVGEVDQVRFDVTTGQVLSIVIKAGIFHHQSFELPGDLIAGVDDGAVYLNVDREAVKQHILAAS